MNRPSRSLPVTHGQDHGRPAANHVSAGIQPWTTRETRFVGENVAPLCGLEAGGGRLHQRIWPLSDGDNNRIYVEGMLAARDRYRSAAAGSIRVGQVHV